MSPPARDPVTKKDKAKREMFRSEVKVSEYSIYIGFLDLI